jgi:hypothetical protein
MPSPVNRRAVLIGLGLIGAAGLSSPALAQQALPEVAVSKDPSCGCCESWVEHLRGAGFRVKVAETVEMSRLKARLGVPQGLASCHTGEVGGYVIEGHVPADEIKRLLAERPAARGLAVPGMPVGSPGMEVAGMEPDTYDVVLFGPQGQRAFARYRGPARA